MKLLKSEDEKELRVERHHHIRHYSLLLDKNLCKGCGICTIVCPKEAMTVLPIEKAQGEKAKHPTIDISEERCIYCGICDAICPFGALILKIDGKHEVPVFKTESFPQIIREVEIDTTKCEVGCSDCEKACPLNIIKTRRVSPLERAREIVRSKKESTTKTRPLVDVNLDLCAGCRLCEPACPQKAISVKKIFHGSIKINIEKCSEGCQDCLDVCPFPGALYLGDDRKVHINEAYCTYCGVCKNVCPTEGALELKRTYIHHTPVHSGAWNKALEKLTSTTVLAKELSVRSQKEVIARARSLALKSKKE